MWDFTVLLCGFSKINIDKSLHPRNDSEQQNYSFSSHYMYLQLLLFHALYSEIKNTDKILKVEHLVTTLIQPKLLYIILVTITKHQYLNIVSLHPEYIETYFMKIKRANCVILKININTFEISILTEAVLDFININSTLNTNQ